MKSKLFIAALLLSCTTTKPEQKPGPVLVNPTNNTPASTQASAPAPASEKATAPKELVNWRKDISFAKLLEEAKASNKNIMIDVYATWCGPCQEMDKSVYTRQDVADATKDLLAIKLDGERGDGAEVHEKYNVVGFPTILFLHPDGTEIDRIFGGVNADGFIKSTNDFSQSKNTIAELEAKLVAAGDKADLDLIYEVGFRHCIRGDEAKATEILTRAINLDKDNAKGFASQAVYALGAFLYLRGQGNAPKAIEMLTRLQKEYPASKEAKTVSKDLAKAYLLNKQPEKTRELLDQMIADKDADSSKYNEYAWFCFQRKYDMPRGIEVAKMGLEKNPKDDALWDTLAELLFATNDAKGALAATEKAIEIDPTSPYYQEQKLRFGGVR